MWREPGYVYVLGYEGSVLKVGSTASLSERVLHIRSTTKQPFWPLFVTRCAPAMRWRLENTTHKRLSQWRAHGREWFAVGLPKAIDAIRQAGRDLGLPVRAIDFEKLLRIMTTMTGDELRKARQELGLTQEELGKLAGMAQPNVARAEAMGDAQLSKGAIAQIRTGLHRARIKAGLRKAMSRKGKR